MGIRACVLDSSRLYYGLFVAAFLLVLLSAIAHISAQKLEFIPQQDYSRYQCLTGGDGRKTLEVLGVLELQFESLAPQLCADSTVAAHYSRVSILWRYADQLDLKSIYEKRYHLVLSTPELLHRTRLESGKDYAAIATYPDTASYLFALNQAPVATAAYFRNKRLGLKDDPISRSGYLIPQALLQQLGLDQSQLEILYYKSHSELHGALLRGEVDVIASANAAQLKKGGSIGDQVFASQASVAGCALVPAPLAT